MGDKNVQIHNNYASGYGTAILNGTGGLMNQGLITANNTFISIGGSYADGDNTPWRVPTRQSTNDAVYKVGQSGLPAAPAQPSGAGASTDGTTVSNPPPVTTPTTPVSTTATPTNFVGTSPSTGEIDLSWTDKSGGKATYVLQRKTTNGGDGWATIANLGAKVTSYKDKTNIQASFEYDYQLVAVQGGVSSNSTVATVQAQSPATPVVGGSSTAATAPTNVNAVAASSSEIDLSWTDNTGGAATYVLQRKSTRGSDPYITIATLKAGTTAYKDTTNVQAIWEYDYHVTAVVGSNTSSAIYAHVQALPVGQVASNPVDNSGGNTTGGTTGGGDSTSDNSNWNDVDLGDSDTDGSSVVANKTYKVTSGASTDSNGTSHFVYEQTSGNTSVVARVTDVSSLSEFWLCRRQH